MFIPHSTNNLRCISYEGGQGNSGEYKPDSYLAPCKLGIYVHNPEVQVFVWVIIDINCEIVISIVQLRDIGDLKPGANTFLAVAAAFNIHIRGW